jgi:hypothetical protein
MGDGTAAQVRGARSLQTKRAGDVQPNTAAPVSASAPKRSAIVTIRTTGEDMTPEEHKRRGDAADALFREIVRRVADAVHPGRA